MTGEQRTPNIDKLRAAGRRGLGRAAIDPKKLAKMPWADRMREANLRHLTGQRVESRLGRAADTPVNDTEPSKKEK